MSRHLLAVLLAALCALLGGMLLDSDPMDLEMAELTPLLEETPGATTATEMETMRVTDAEARTPSGPQPEVETASPAAATPGHLSGIVLDTAGQPVEAAVVEVDGHSDVSGPDGRFTFEVRGVVRVAAHDATRRARARLVHAGRAPIRLVLEDAAALSVAVTARDGKPAPGSTVVAYTETGVAEAQADHAGVARFVRLPAGRVRIQASAPEALSAARSVAVPSGGQATIRLQLRPAASVRGTVRAAADRTALAGVRIEVSGMGFHPVLATTDAEGRFEVAAVPPQAALTVRALKAGFAGVLLRDVQADAGDAMQIELRAQPALEGRVLDSAGRGVAGARVTLRDGPRAPLSETTSDAGGAFRLPVPALEDTRLLVVAAHGAAAGALPAEQATSEGVLPPLVLLAAGSVRGRITELGEGTPLRLLSQVSAHTDLQILPGAAPVAVQAMVGTPRLATRTDATGGFVFDPVPAGVYRLAAVTPEGTWSPLREIVVAGEDVSLAPLSSAGRRLAGSVTDLDGRPLPGARVVVQAAALDAAARLVMTDAQGRFALLGLPEGAYRIRAVLPGYASRGATAAIPGAAEVELRLAGLATFVGRVEDPDGLVSGAATLDIHDLLEAEPAPRSIPVFVRAGSFRLPDLRAGEYRFALRTQDGRSAESGFVDLRPAQSAEARFDLGARVE